MPEKAAVLADRVLTELVKELNIRPVPVVFASFSGGPKGCTYKVLQLIEGRCKGQLSLGDYQLVRDCVCGQIYDSSPVDFVSDLGTRFLLHPSVLKMPEPPRVLSWMTRGIASGLDTLFIGKFEAQRKEYWETLYSSVHVGPILIFCSEDDELAPCSVVQNFGRRLLELGGDVNLVKWHSSPHVELCANRDQSVSHIHGYYINYNCLIDQALLDQSNSMNVVELDYVWTSVSRLAMLDKAYVELEVRQI
ncbi:unnamed protein product [Triticum turgidum subsp. durum]|nr:unnamed protein product [Triticum turgidum subsp. durum]